MNFSFDPSNQKHLFSLSLIAFMFLVIPITVFAVLQVEKTARNPKAAGVNVPLLDTKDGVVFTENMVKNGSNKCSFVSSNQTNVGIKGEDGGSSVRVGSTNYFFFGDTVLTSGQIIPNSVSTTTDLEASDCVSMNSKTSGGRAVSLIDKAPGECTVWPTDTTSVVTNNKLYFFYSPLNSACQVMGVGLASMDLTSLNSTRVIDLIFRVGDGQTPNYKILSATSVKQGSFVFILFQGQDSSGKDVVLLGAVSPNGIANKANYQYWDGTQFQTNPANMKPLWDQGPVGMNGLTMRYNGYLQKWTAFYNTGYVSEMVERTANSIIGPWSRENQVINCLQYFVLGTSGNSYPCYGAKEHPEYQKNSGQTIYVSHSNTDLYQPFLHEIIFGKAVNQWVDTSGNAIYKLDPNTAAGAAKEGTAFYASSFPGSNFSSIEDWVNSSGEHQYSATSPGTSFTDLGTAFYAPTSPVNGLAAIYRWDLGSIHRYSALDLTILGFSKGPLSFYAKITNYRVKDANIYLQNGSNFEVGVQKNGSWVSTVHLNKVSLTGLIPSSVYSLATNTPLVGNRFFGQNLTADNSGTISFSGDLGYINVLDLAVFPASQSLDTSSNLFTYQVSHTGTNDAPSELNHQLDPYYRGSNFKSFMLNGTPSTYQGIVSGAPSWSGPVSFCDRNLTLTPTGATKCGKLKMASFGGLTANTVYDLYYCTPNCENSLVKVVYEKTSDANGVVNFGDTPLPPPTSDITPPSVNITSPVSGSTIISTVNIAANNQDNVGVVRLDTLLDKTIIDTKTSPVPNPANITLVTDKYPNGTHNITVKAYDAAGNVGTASVNVNINNPTYSYWVHITGQFESGCCGTNNPSAKTTSKSMLFTLQTTPSPLGYQGVVCTPDCSGTTVWSGPVTFTPNATGGTLTLTPTGQK